jgi:hypothetical protein
MARGSYLDQANSKNRQSYGKRQLVQTKMQQQNALGKGEYERTNNSVHKIRVSPREPESRLPADSELSAISHVGHLVEKYSKFTLHRVLRQSKNGNGSILILEDTKLGKSRIPIAKYDREQKLVQNTIHGGHLNLPILTQVQRVLAYHSSHNIGNSQNAIAMLSKEQIIQPTMPKLSFVRKTGGNNQDSGSFTNTRMSARLMGSVSPPNEVDMRLARQGNRATLDSQNNMKVYKTLSLRELRKMMEQIFQEELLRHGL